MPMGAPGWPDLAFWTASMESTRIAFAICRCEVIDYCRSTWEMGRYFLLKAGLQQLALRDVIHETD